MFLHIISQYKKRRQTMSIIYSLISTTRQNNGQQSKLENVLFETIPSSFHRSDNIFCKDISSLAMLKDTLELIYYGLWGYTKTIKLWSLLSSNSCIDNKMSCSLLDISLMYHNIFDTFTSFIQARHRELRIVFK